MSAATAVRAKRTAEKASPDVNSYLLGYARPLWLLTLVGTVLAVGTRGIVLLLPKLVSRIVDTASAQVDPATLNTTGALFVGGILAVALLQSVSNLLFSYIGERMSLALRHDLVSHVLSMSMDFFERRKVGDVMARVSADASVVREIATTLPLRLVTHLVTLVGVLVIVLATNLRLTAIMLVFLPFIGVSAWVFGRLVRRIAAGAQQEFGRANAALEESLSGIGTVKTFAQEEAELGRFDGWLRKVYGSNMQLARAREVMSLSGHTIVYGSLALVTWYGTSLILGGELTTGEFISFMLYALIAGNSLAALTGVWSSWERLRGTSERLVEVVNERPSVLDAPNPLPFDGNHQRIAFHSVDFSYPTDPKPVLAGVDFTVERGQHVAIVGESGAGKSTVAALLLRLYDVTGGSITIDGRDIRKLAKHDLRRAIAVVPQDIVVFGRTVRENITFGKPDATEEEVIAAARAAYALDFIQALPLGFDTVLGERGVTISGGQRQRIAIARAILKDPTILVLDEATSALDKHSEESVARALANLMEDRTTLVIAHKLATIERADRVLVLHEGELVEAGSHAQLLGAGGHYDRLYRTGTWQEGAVA